MVKLLGTTKFGAFWETKRAKYPGTESSVSTLSGMLRSEIDKAYPSIMTNEELSGLCQAAANVDTLNEVTGKPLCDIYVLVTEAQAGVIPF